MPAMNNPAVNVEQTHWKEEQKVLPGAAHKALLFYFGVLATAIEETYAFASRLIEHREIAEQKGRKLLHERMNERNGEAHRVGGAVSTHVESAKKRKPLASKTDINALDEKIIRLSKQIDEIKKS